MKAAGVAILIIILLLLAAAVGWVLFARWRAQRLGLPPPSWSSFIPFRSSRSSYGVQPAPGGIRGWVNDHFYSFKSRNDRTATGAYESPAPSGSRARAAGFGPLDPDDAWDTRVGNEADAYYYNEEQELGLHPPNRGGGAVGSNSNNSRLNVSNTSYLGSGTMGGSSYDMNLAASTEALSDEQNERGRPRGRSPGTDIGTAGGGGGGRLNPFDDGNADPSNMSLRGVSPRPIVDTEVAAASDGSKVDSPDGRRSIFRENV